MLTRAVGGRAPIRSESCGKEGEMLMSTYEEFMVLVTFALLVVAILDYTHKK
jgi:hypothetical protein